MYTKHKLIERMECKTIRKQYDKEFKIHAAKLVDQTGKAVTQVARELDVAEQTLHNWVKSIKKVKTVQTISAVGTAHQKTKQ